MQKDRNTKKLKINWHGIRQYSEDIMLINIKEAGKHKKCIEIITLEQKIKRKRYIWKRNGEKCRKPGTNKRKSTRLFAVVRFGTTPLPPCSVNEHLPGTYSREVEKLREKEGVSHCCLCHLTRKMGGGVRTQTRRQQKN
jgi:hypothetical protein